MLIVRVFDLSGHIRLFGSVLDVCQEFTVDGQSAHAKNLIAMFALGIGDYVFRHLTRDLGAQNVC